MMARRRTSLAAIEEAWFPPRKSRWRYANGREPGRVFVVSGRRRRQLRVICRVVSADHADGLAVQFKTCDFRGRAAVLKQVSAGDREGVSA